MPSTEKLLTSKALPPAPSNPPTIGPLGLSPPSVPSVTGPPSERCAKSGSSPANVRFVSERVPDAAATPSTSSTVSIVSASKVEPPGPLMSRESLISVESPSLVPESAPNSNRPGAAPSSGAVGSCDTVRSVPTP
jgi:hypothetical protein